MKDPNNINRDELLVNLEERLRRNRNKPVSLFNLTVGFFGYPDDSYRDKWLFHRAKLMVCHAIKKLRKNLKLHIFSVDSGYIVIEKREDFDIMIKRARNRKNGIIDFIKQLEIDKISDRYKARVNRFFKRKVSTKEFNNIAKRKLIGVKRRKYERMKAKK